MIQSGFPPNHSYSGCHVEQRELLMIKASVLMFPSQLPLIKTSLCCVPRPCRAHWAAVSSRPASSQWPYPRRYVGLYIGSSRSVPPTCARRQGKSVSQGAFHQPTQMRRLNETKLALPKTTGLGICWELIIWSSHLRVCPVYHLIVGKQETRLLGLFDFT